MHALPTILKKCENNKHNVYLENSVKNQPDHTGMMSLSFRVESNLASNEKKSHYISFKVLLDTYQIT